jgi:hypothetical protein
VEGRAVARFHRGPERGHLRLAPGRFVQPGVLAVGACGPVAEAFGRALGGTTRWVIARGTESTTTQQRRRTSQIWALPESWAASGRCRALAAGRRVICHRRVDCALRSELRRRKRGEIASGGRGPGVCELVVEDRRQALSGPDVPHGGRNDRWGRCKPACSSGHRRSLGSAWPDVDLVSYAARSLARRVSAGDPGRAAAPLPAVTARLSVRR